MNICTNIHTNHILLNSLSPFSPPSGHPARHGGRPSAEDGRPACSEGSAAYGSHLSTLAISRKLGVTYAAYSPLGQVSRVDVLRLHGVKAIANARQRSPAQVALRWVTQQRIPLTTASSDPLHVDEILSSLHFNLTSHEMKRLYTSPSKLVYRSETVTSSAASVPVLGRGRLGTT